MHTELRHESGHWSLYVNGVRIIDRESFAIADRVKARLDNPALDDHSEATEIARSIRDWVTRCTEHGAIGDSETLAWDAVNADVPFNVPNRKSTDRR